MPFRFESDEVHRIIRAVFEGPCTDDDVVEAYYALRLLWERQGPANLIIDYTGVTNILISTEAVREHSYRLPTVDTDYFLIAVAPKPIMYGIARMFEFITTETRPNMHVVHSMKDALTLMDLSLASFIPAGIQRLREVAALLIQVSAAIRAILFMSHPFFVNPLLHPVFSISN